MTPKEIRALVEKWLPVRSELVEVIAKAAHSDIAAAIESGALHAATKHSMTPSFDVFNPEVSAWIRDYTLKLAESVADTTLRDLSKTLAEGLEAGESLHDLRDRVGDVLGPDSCEYRSEE